MKTIAIEVGAAEHVFAHQICSTRFDTALKKIEITLANRKEYTLGNANIEGYRALVRQLVTTMNSPQPVMITGIEQPAIAPQEPTPSTDGQDLCASCGENPVVTDGLCQDCLMKSLDEPNSFDGPKQ